MPKQQPIYDAKGEQALMLELWSPEIKDDPRNFVRFAYPWRQPGTPLADIDGPRNWQDQILKDIGDYVRSATDEFVATTILPSMFKAAVASGRGIGKSATFGWLAHWMVSTRIGSSVWVAANSEEQLKTKTFAEIARWVSMGINAHWWEIMATSIRPAEWLSEAVKRDLKIDPAYWAIQGQLWSKEAPDAFAGAHNSYGEMALFDEASGIPSEIWTVQQGVFTEKIVDRYWLAFSNPRRNSGAFYNCFDKESTWRQYQIDARTVEGLPQDAYNDIIREHGPNSREAFIEVYGKFPDQSSNQFIPHGVVVSAQQRAVSPDDGAPRLMGVDIARSGSDQTVICFRQGNDARSLPWTTFRSGDTVFIAERVAELADKFKPDAIFIDGNGVGAGPTDMLKRWRYNVIEVQAGSAPADKDAFINKRVEMWALMKNWLHNACLPVDEELKAHLTTLEYDYRPQDNKLRLESKDQLKARGEPSPDKADALAMTFARPIARKDNPVSRGGRGGPRIAKDVDYDMFGG